MSKKKEEKKPEQQKVEQPKNQEQPKEQRISLAQFLQIMKLQHPEIQNQEKPDLAFELEKAGLAECQQAQGLKKNISFFEAYDKEHKKQMDLMSDLLYYKFISLKRAGFMPEQAFTIIINKDLFNF